MIDRLRQSRQRFLSLFRRARLDQEHDAVVAAHLDLAMLNALIFAIVIRDRLGHLSSSSGFLNWRFVFQFLLKNV